jgi:hypothetical protein
LANSTSNGRRRMSLNPYESSSTAAVASTAVVANKRRVPTTLGLLAWCYPGLMMISFYGTWFIAWSVLGHMPRPSLDDPKCISIAVDISYVFAGLLLVGFPAAALLGVMLQLFFTDRSWPKKLSLSLVLVGVWIVTIAFLRWDPWSVTEWYMD